MYWILDDIDIGFRTVANSISLTAAPKHSARCLTTVASSFVAACHGQWSFCRDCRGSIGAMAEEPFGLG